MTTLTFDTKNQLAAPTQVRPPEPSLFKAWTSSFLVFFYPARIGKLWVNVPLTRASLVFAVNLILGWAWMLLLLVAVAAWSGSRLHVNPRNFNTEFVDRPVQAFLRLFGTVPAEFLAQFKNLDVLEKNALIAFSVMALFTTMAILFFILLPFAARPGQNKACVKHVIRTVLLGSGFVHVWGPTLAGLFIVLIAYRFSPSLAFILGPLLVTIAILILWSFGALVTAARRDYRTPADLPQPRDPTCDDCGYDLVAADPVGRCPECGRPVNDSLGPHTRQPTRWEINPSPMNFKTVGNQLSRLVRQPRKLFLEMPTLTGQSAAHRWLLYSLALIAAAAFFIVPGIWLAIFRGDADFTLDYVWGGIIVGLIWALLGLMMVGIETAGIAAFSRMKGHPVYLAAAAKVTAYSSPLMLLWVLLGAAQLILTIYLWDQKFFRPYSIRVEQVYLALSLSLAHIGGLLWYELTVYRGIRSIQYANK